ARRAVGPGRPARSRVAGGHSRLPLHHGRGMRPRPSTPPPTSRSPRALAAVTTPLCTLDLARMRRERIEKLRTAMEAAGVDVLLCCSQNNVSYATGARVPAADHARAGWWRPVVVFEREAEWPRLYTRFPDGAPTGLPDECLHPGITVETHDGADQLARALPSGVLALDDAPFPLWEAVR